MGSLFIFVNKHKNITVQKGRDMIGRLNELENQVLDILQRSDLSELDEIKRVLGNLNYAVDSAKIGICQWNYQQEIGVANSQFLKNFGIKDAMSFYESRDFIGATFFDEDVAMAKELETKLLAGELDHFMLDIRQNVEGGTRWWRHYITIKDREKGADEELLTAVIWEITAEKESIEKLTRRETQLKELNNRLNSTVKELEQTKTEIMDAYSMLELALYDSHAYVWDWAVPQGVININISLSALPAAQKREVRMNTMTVDKMLEKIHPDDISKIQLDKISTSSSDLTFAIDLRINSRGEGYKWFEFRGRVTERDINGVPSRLKGIGLDIQSRKDNEIELISMKERAEQSEKMKSSFLANMTQELRTPLNAIVDFSDILVNIDSKEERLKYLSDIKRNNDILLELMESVMGYADEGEKPEMLKEDKVNLWEFMVELQQVYSMKIQGPVRLIFTNSYDDLKIIIDKEKLVQILDHLLTNSIKYTDAGYISYGYEIKGDKLIFVVNDTGVGISQDKMADIFKRFESVDAQTNVSGLGLPICKSLVRKMNGDITVNSQPGAGSSFVIELPLKIDSCGKASVIEKEPAEERRIEIKKDLPTILVAEDIIYSYMMMKTMLEDRFNVIHAENGQRAVELFMEERPDFIFMDIKMPVMDGLEATRQIRKISKDVPIIVLTAYAVRSLKKESAEAGCTDMLTKPTTAKQINATIKKYMKSH